MMPEAVKIILKLILIEEDSIMIKMFFFTFSLDKSREGKNNTIDGMEVFFKFLVCVYSKHLIV